jgi:hypothetical protein
MAMGRQLQSSAMTIAFGIGTAVMGLFYILYTLYANPGSQNEPWWLAFVFGLAFLLGGIAVVIQTALATGNPPNDDLPLPATTPRLLKSIYRMMVLGIIASLGIIFTWVAFGPGPRHFTGSGAPLGQTVGRVMFGIGAVLIWITFVAAAIVGVRRLLTQRWNRGRDSN